MEFSVIGTFILLMEGRFSLILIPQTLLVRPLVNIEIEIDWHVI